MYETNQIGRVILGTFFIGLILLIFSLFARKRQNLKKYWFLHGFVFVILVIMMGMSYQLKISIDDNNFHFQFGPGIIQKTIALNDIIDCQPVKNKRWMGFGIRKIKSGWLYNVSGLDAVELTLKDSKSKIRVGTTSPKIVCQKIGF